MASATNADDRRLLLVRRAVEDWNWRQMKPPGTLRKPLRRSSYFVALCFLVFIAVLYVEDFAYVLRRPFQRLHQHLPPPELGVQLHPREKKKDVPRAFAVGQTPSGCDVFAGRWVYDEATRPQYREEECPYIQPQLTCQEHGRPDKGYQHWRWQPHGCALPSFNASFMLEMLRGKRLLFVGDSLNRGQFVSMVCLLHRSIPENAKSMETFDSLTVFTAKEYNATVEFYWAPFLLESNADNAVVHRITDRIVRAGAGSIRKHARHWEGADIIVFNTYLWWMTGEPMKILRGPFSAGYAKNITRMGTEDAYKMALRYLVRWVERCMDPEKTRAFFVTMSPSHGESALWGGAPDGNCYNETTPIEAAAYWGSSSSKGIMRVIGRVLRKSKVPITVVNITQLSEYRRDAHTQIYKKQWNPLTPEQLADPKSYADCVHWCLPGLQDTWNELLYAKLFFP